MLNDFVSLLRLNGHVPVQAYIDPATTTYIIQIVSALVITLSVTLGVFFKRMHMSLLNLRVRLAEWRIRLFSGQKTVKQTYPSPKIKRTTEEVQGGKWSSLWADTRNFKERLVKALPVVAAFVFTFVLFGVFELYSLNSNDFMFDFGSFALTLILFSCALILVLLLLAALLRGRIFDYAISLLFGLLIAGYIQGNFLNRALGELTGDRILWDMQRRTFLLNSLAWLAIIALPFFLRYFKKKLWSFALKALPILLILMQTVSGFTLLAKPSRNPAAENGYLSAQGILELSPKKNIIVIILDRLDNRYVDSVLDDDAHFFDELKGFTRFTNNTSTYSQTFPSLINMLSGKTYDYAIPKEDFLTEVWQKPEFLQDLKAAGYHINIDSDANELAPTAVAMLPLVENVAQAKIHVQQAETLRQFLLLSTFRYAPVSMKPFFWSSTDQFNKMIKTDHESPPYIINDVAFYSQLKDSKLNTTGPDKLFTLLHLNGPHAPYEMNAEAQAVPATESNEIIQTKGSFHIVYEYLKQLQKLGLYDESTIIITGDHGARKNDVDAPERAIVTALFVKPAKANNYSLKTNDAPVSSDNMRPFISKEAGFSYSEDSHKPYFEVSSHDKRERILRHRLVGLNGEANRVLTYKIVGDANDFANWELIDDQVSVY